MSGVGKARGCGPPGAPGGGGWWEEARGDSRSACAPVPGAVLYAPQASVPVKGRGWRISECLQGNLVGVCERERPEERCRLGGGMQGVAGWRSLQESGVGECWGGGGGAVCIVQLRERFRDGKNRSVSEGTRGRSFSVNRNDSVGKPERRWLVVGC